MGTAGLDVEKLTGLLQRIYVDCTLIEGDEAYDHCVLRLTSLANSVTEALLVYENQGMEPRVVTLEIKAENIDGDDRSVEQVGQSFQVTEHGIHLRGTKRDDPLRIFELVQTVFKKAPVSS